MYTKNIIEDISELFLDVMPDIINLGIRPKFFRCEVDDSFSNIPWMKGIAYMEVSGDEEKNAGEIIFSVQLDPYGPVKRLCESRENGNRTILFSSLKSGNCWEEYGTRQKFLEYLKSKVV